LPVELHPLILLELLNDLLVIKSELIESLLEATGISITLLLELVVTSLVSLLLLLVVNLAAVLLDLVSLLHGLEFLIVLAFHFALVVLKISVLFISLLLLRLVVCFQLLNGLLLTFDLELVRLLAFGITNLNIHPELLSLSLEVITLLLGDEDFIRLNNLDAFFGLGLIPSCHFEDADNIVLSSRVNKLIVRRDAKTFERGTVSLNFKDPLERLIDDHNTSRAVILVDTG
jgi:hypothetical protein